MSVSPPATSHPDPPGRLIAPAVDRLLLTGHEVVVGVIGSPDPGLREHAQRAADVTLQPQDLLTPLDPDVIVAVADPDLERGAQRFDRFVDALARERGLRVGYADSRRRDPGAVIVAQALDARRRRG
jgi:hypothetical protein